MTFAFLLRKVVTGEHDLILDWFTLDHGRMDCIAKGGQRSKKRFAGVLEPFQMVRLQLEQRDHSMAVLTEASLEARFVNVSHSWENMRKAGIMHGWVLKLLEPHHPEPEAFQWFRESLQHIDAVGIELVFALKLSQTLGHHPQVDACVICGKKAPNDVACLFDFRLGGIVCAACRKEHTAGYMFVTAALMKTIRDLFHANDFAALDLKQIHDPMLFQFVNGFFQEHFLIKIEKA